MAFAKEATRTPVAIAGLRVELYSPDPNGSDAPTADYRVTVRYSDDSTNELRGNLIPHLTQSQINSLLSFMATLRTKAVNEILP